MSDISRGFGRLPPEPWTLNAGASTSPSMLASTRARSAGCPHHHVATLGVLRSSPSNWRQSRGRKPRIAFDSRTPEPGMFRTATPPLRIASSSPGVPRREALFSSSGSMKSASTRRRITSARFSPAIVRM